MSSLTDLTLVANEIIKTDNRGRVRVSPERRNALLDEFERSGMTARAFAKFIGVHPTTFAGWHRRRRKAKGTGGAVVQKGKRTPVRLIEAVAAHPAPESASGLTIELAGVARLELRQSGQVALAAELIALMAGRKQGVAAC
jgi:transposase